MRYNVAATMLKMFEEDPNIKTLEYIRDPKFVIRMTRHNKSVKYPKSDDRHECIIYSQGRPNYLAVRFIRQCVKAGEPFPIKKIRVKYFPKK